MGIVLLGYRGSGKSAVGYRLAARLRLPFIDTDQEVMQTAGATIADIFTRAGEGRFRTMESAALAQALAPSPSRPDGIIATGGGIVLAEVNLFALKASRFARIYLRCEPEELLRRIEADPASAAARPNLTAAGGIAEIRQLLAVREPYYKEVMTAELDVTRLDVDEAVAAILQMI
jgi:shikimate kinase